LSAAVGEVPDPRAPETAAISIKRWVKEARMHSSSARRLPTSELTSKMVISNPKSLLNYFGLIFMVTHPSGVLTAIRPALVVMILQCNKADNDFRSHSNSPFELKLNVFIVLRPGFETSGCACLGGQG
jgi:hypothetical protein